MKDSIADLFKRPPDDEERLPSPYAFWNPGEWLLLRLSHQHASQLLVFLNANETQAAIDKWPAVAALRNEINSHVDIGDDQEA